MATAASIRRGLHPTGRWPRRPPDLLLLAAAALLSSVAPGSGCEFAGLLAQCNMVVGGIPLKVTASVNHCATPIDVTFAVRNDQFLENAFYEDGRDNGSHLIPRQSSAEKVSWEYTFVTSNQPESRRIPGYDLVAGGAGGDADRHSVLFHMQADSSRMRHSLGKVIDVRAQFIVNGQTDESLTFLDGAEVKVAHFDDCAGSRHHSEVNYIALGAVVVIILLALVASVSFFLYRHRRNSEDEQTLVNNMQQTTAAPQSPYNLTDVPNSRQLDSVHYLVASRTNGKDRDQQADPATACTSTPIKRSPKDLLPEDRPQAGGVDPQLPPPELPGRSTQPSSGPDVCRRGPSASETTPGSLGQATRTAGRKTPVIPDMVAICLDEDSQEDLPPPPLPRKPQIQDPLTAFSSAEAQLQARATSSKGRKKVLMPDDTRLNNSHLLLMEESSSASESGGSSSSRTSGDRSLGAIPKRRMPQSLGVTLNGVAKPIVSPASASSSTSTNLSR